MTCHVVWAVNSTGMMLAAKRQNTCLIDCDITGVLSNSPLAEEVEVES